MLRLTEDEYNFLQGQVYDVPNDEIFNRLSKVFEGFPDEPDREPAFDDLELIPKHTDAEYDDIQKELIETIERLYKLTDLGDKAVSIAELVQKERDELKAKLKRVEKEALFWHKDASIADTKVVLLMAELEQLKKEREQ